MKRDDENYKKVMHTCLCQTVMFKKVTEIELITTLKGVIDVLTYRDDLSTEDQEKYLMFFGEDYNLGLSKPLSREHIKEKLIPLILNFPVAEMSRAIRIIQTSETHNFAL